MISIVIPVYNVENYIERCISSVLKQTFKEIEIIVVNDGSTDNSLEICKKYENEDSRIVLISQLNGGLSDARNTGIKKAKFPYITFLDSDDWIDETFIEVLYSSLINYNADISIVEYDVVYKEKAKKKLRNNNRKVQIYNNIEAMTELFLDKRIKNYAWAKMYKKSLFNDIVYPKGVYFEDVYTTYKLFYKSNKIVKINQVLLHYFQHDSNITSKVTNTTKKEIDFFNGFMEQFHFAIKKQNEIKNMDKVKASFLKQFFRLKRRLKKNREKLSIEEEVNIQIKNLLKEIPLLNIGFINYFKYKIILKK